MLNTKILSFLFLIFLFFSCKKDKSPEDPVLPVQIDTLVNWQKIEINSSDTYNDIWFINASTGYSCANEGLYSSVDSGKTWSLKSGLLKRYINLFFISSSVGYAQRIDSIAVTFDGGNNWVAKKGPPINVHDIFFISASTGFAFGNGQQLYKTKDSANTWTPVTNYNASALFFLSPLTGFLKQADGFIYYTSDGGTTWQKISTSNIPTSNWEYLFFNNIATGWLINNNKGLYNTSDGGITWNNKLSINDAIDCSFFNNQEGFVSSLSNIFYTSDGGNTWNTEVKAHTAKIIEMYFLDKNTGWACGTNGLILRYKK
jgi:photosystem II stability/assembly factor-like uncharacterized protein